MGTLAWGLFRITQTPLLLLLLSLSLSYPASSLPHRSTYTDRELSWMHNRPPEASYLLPRRNRDLGVLYMGATERMRLVVHKMMAGGARGGGGRGLMDGRGCPHPKGEYECPAWGQWPRAVWRTNRY